MINVISGDHVIMLANQSKITKQETLILRRYYSLEHKMKRLRFIENKLAI